MRHHALASLTLALSMAASAALLAPATARAHGEPPPDGFDLRQAVAAALRATRPFNDLQAAQAAGYVKFPDQSGDCVDQPGQGGMGVHYLNAALLDDPALDPLKPEFLVYQPEADGSMALAALEYVVFAPVWDALHPQPPQLFGHPFHLVRTPNRYGTPMPFYELHVWAWEPNPDGLFNDWNPRVACR
ncbi:MAG: hypothetical protein U1F50_04660 [Rubrivivax sp.]